MTQLAPTTVEVVKAGLDSKAMRVQPSGASATSNNRQVGLGSQLTVSQSACGRRAASPKSRVGFFEWGIRKCFLSATDSDKYNQLFCLLGQLLSKGEYFMITLQGLQLHLHLNNPRVEMCLRIFVYIKSQCLILDFEFFVSCILLIIFSKKSQI